MSSETLTQPSNELKDVYNDLAHLEGGADSVALVSRIDVDLVDPGVEKHGYDNRTRYVMREKQEGNKVYNDTYNVIVAAAHAPSDELCEQTWGAITPERIGFNLSVLARKFRITHTEGYLTTYGRAAPTTPHPSDRKNPWDAERTPLSMESAEVERLLVSPENEKIAVLSEVLDPYRYRTDPDAPKEQSVARQAEQEQAFLVLQSMAPTVERDLLATEAVRHFDHPNIARGDLAEQAVLLLSDPLLQQALSSCREQARAYAPANIVESVKATSSQALERLLKPLSPQIAANLRQKAVEHAPDYTVTINVSLHALERALLDSNRLLPVSETRASSINPFETGAERRKAEADYGTHPLRDRMLERPIYGALAVTKQEHVLGARNAEKYGECVVALKDEVAEERTVYTYGDSMNVRYIELGDNTPATDKVMNMHDAAVAKQYFDQINGLPGKGIVKYDYVEAQILGGVSPADIKTITVPVSAAYRDEGILRVIKQRYPSIEMHISFSDADGEQGKNLEVFRDELEAKGYVLDKVDV